MSFPLGPASDPARPRWPDGSGLALLAFVYSDPGEYRAGEAVPSGVAGVSRPGLTPNAGLPIFGPCRAANGRLLRFRC